MIRVQILPDKHAAASEAAGLIADLIRAKPAAVIGLATGSTPVGCYAELARLHREEGLSFRAVRTFNLDEYRGLAPDHPQSYRRFMDEQLFGKIDIPRRNTRVLGGRAEPPQAECEAFEREICDAGGVDLWLLGIGGNGHIAFNEPGSAPNSRTRVAALSPETIAANSDGRFFTNPAEVPREALTAGIATIREARRIVLLACGAAKAAAVAAAITGPMTPDCPASFLQDHPDCVFLADREAAELL